MTKQQQLILRLVQTSCMHCTADEICRAAKEQLPSIGIATVYRNLAQLSEAGVIRRVETVGEADRYDLAVARHEHAVCRKCGAMRNVDVRGICEKIQKALSTADFTYSLSIHELCPKCKAMESALEAPLSGKGTDVPPFPEIPGPLGAENAEAALTKVISQ